MDEHPEPQRIEVELTAHGPDSARPRADDRNVSASGSAHAPGPVEPVARRPIGPAPGRIVLVAGASAIAATALLIGVVLGRMGAGDDVAISDATTPTSTPTDSVATRRADRSDSADTLPPAGRELTSPTPPTTTAETGSVPGQPVAGSIAIDPAVSASGVEVIALTRRGDIVRIDVGTGATMASSVSGTRIQPNTIQAGDGWILVPLLDGRTATVLFDDGSQASIDAGAGFPLLPTGTSGHLWRVEGDGFDGIPQRLVEISIDGVATGAEIELDGFFPQMIDPLGGIAVEAPGGSYVVTVDGTTRLTTGRLLAIGRDRAFVDECDEELVCDYFVVDRVTAERRAVTLDAALGERVTLERIGWWPFQNAMNATEDAVLVVAWGQFSTGAPSYGAVDLETGAYTEIGNMIDDPNLQWGPGGRNVFWLEQGRLRVFSLDTGESVAFSEDLDPVTAFTLRTAPAG